MSVDESGGPGRARTGGTGGSGGSADTRDAGAGAGRRRGAIAVWLSGPLMSFHLVITVTALLSLSGLAMVLSASSVESYDESGSPYSMFVSQLLVTALGGVLFYLALRIPVSWVRRAAPAALVITLLLLVLVLVPGIGSEVQGSRRWIELGGGMSLQPSEVMKLVLAIWGAHILTRGKTMTGWLGEPKVRLVLASLLTFALVMLEPSLSTTIALALIVAALLWFAGLPGRWFAGLAALGLASVGVLAMTSGYRAQRIQSFLNPGSHPKKGGYQALQAKYSLADGGLFGRGPGQSRAKWNYLPNSHNDFIFAIIGEELGLIGCLVVIALFVLFAYAGLRIMRRSADPFLRLLAGAITVWTVAQAAINIGYVVGVLPVTGLQLPLISAGGSSTAITLAAFGLLASAARHEPEAVAALRSGRTTRLPRWLRLPAPAPYRPERMRSGRPDTGARAEKARRMHRRHSVGGARPAPRTGQPGSRSRNDVHRGRGTAEPGPAARPYRRKGAANSRGAPSPRGGERKRGGSW